jgi:hypothetical protein
VKFRRLFGRRQLDGPDNSQRGARDGRQRASSVSTLLFLVKRVVLSASRLGRANMLFQTASDSPTFIFVPRDADTRLVAREDAIDPDCLRHQVL